MSTTARFAYLGRFLACLVDAPLATLAFGSGAWVGPFTLAEAMALYWNSETVVATFTDPVGTPVTATMTGINGATAATPRNRICTSDQYFSVSVSLAYNFSFALHLPQLYNGGYFFEVIGRIFDDLQDHDVYFDLLDANAGAMPMPGNVEVARYTATVFGKSVILVLWGDAADMDGSEAPEPIPPTYDPGLVITANYYTF